MTAHPTRTIAAAALALLVGAALPAAAAAPGPTQVTTLQDARIKESSGLVASARFPDVYWTHNDSGDAPRLYAVGTDGRTKATVTLAGVEARDWEAVSVGADEAGQPALFVGDIGDNLHGTWPEVWIYRVPEPTVLKDTTVTPVRYRVQYEDGPRDAEALMVDPRTNKLHIASKEASAGVYVQPDTLSATGVNTFRRIAAAPPLVTDGAFSPDGTRLLLRGYFSATMFGAPGQEIGPVDVPMQRQGESAAFTRDGRAVLFGSEGENSPVWRVDLDGKLLPDSVAATGRPGGTAPAPAPGQAQPELGGGDQEGDAGRPRTETYGPGFLAVLLLVATGYGVLRLRRSRSGK